MRNLSAPQLPKPYDVQFLDLATRPGMQMRYCEARLSVDTVALAQDPAAIRAFVNTDLSRPALVHLPEIGVRGGTHFLMSDLNNVEIADQISKFLADKTLD